MTPAKAKAAVRAYIATQSPKARASLKTIRAAIRAVAPKAVDGFSYRIPSVTLGGKTLVWYAGFKEHCSLFPMTEAIRSKFARALKGYTTAKGTVRLPLARPIPTGLVKRLVRARIAEMQKVKRA